MVKLVGARGEERRGRGGEKERKEEGEGRRGKKKKAGSSEASANPGAEQQTIFWASCKNAISDGLSQLDKSTTDRSKQLEEVAKKWKITVYSSNRCILTMAGALPWVFGVVH